ncbi:ligand-binding sensor domain-containing protein [Flavihumibacter profundi]|uniref:hypothetical protein n=1 Tax=Flavihumibacter profundi TaxID=2716883 RepID=UPI001CC69D92|nr:hypothetical protein [Flavihumibacter profundi]MBZ5856012.1 hypothetical protein [Flavihumibacter profundi]
MRKSFSFLTTFVLLFAQIICFGNPANEPVYKQPVSIQYSLPETLKGAILKKVVVDYNDNVYVLTNKGVYRTNGKDLVKDFRYTPIAEKKPLDITIQENTGHLFYLYEEKWLTNGYAGVPYLNIPKGKFDQLAVAADGTVLLVGANAVSLCRDGKLTEIKKPADKINAVQVNNGIFYALSANGVYKLSDDHFTQIHKGNGLQAMALRENEIVLGTTKGYYGINKLNGDSSFSLQTKVPVENISCLQVIDNKVWAGTPMGAFMKEPAGNYRYYASRRWLNEDKVIAMAADSKGDAYFLSPSGLNKIEFIPFTLLDKANLFQDQIRQRHIRYGFISNVTLQSPGDLASAKMTDTDNDGLWSSFYLGSQAFRYAVTGDKNAKRYAWEAFEAFERIISINPLKGFPARTFERKGFKVGEPAAFRDSQDPEWEWKGTTSSDEFCGYIFIASVLNEMVAETESEKKRVADFIDKILTHIIDNNYYFVDADGKPTLWGRWNPEYINSFPESVEDRKLGSAHILAGLQLAYALTGKEKYKTEAYKLINEHGYLKNMMVSYTKIKETPGTIRMGIDLGIGGWNHSDDEMAFLTYWPLYRYAFTPELQEQYKWVITDHWQIEKPERNALWNLISLATAGVCDAPSVNWHLQEYPLDLVRWNVKNSHRKDIVLLPANFRKQSTEVLLPPGERPMNRHNANAFELDGGENGMSELAGDEYLLPYWMGRYLKVIE